MKHQLSRDDLWTFVIGASVYATGGGTTVPSEERFHRMVDDLESKQMLPQLIDPSDVLDDWSIFKHLGAGGGIQPEVRTKYPLAPGGDAWYERWVKGFDQTEWMSKQIQIFGEKYPLAKWSEPPTSEWRDRGDAELAKIVGAESSATILGEIGPNGIYEIVNSGRKGIPVIDGDTAGGRAVPEISISIPNLTEVNPCPVIFTTLWGDLLRIEKVLNFQRLEDISRQLAVSAGGSASGVYRLTGYDLKRSIASGTVTKSIKLGQNILEGRKSHDILQRILSSGSLLLFKGKVQLFVRKLENSFHWGEITLEGTEEFQGHQLRIWFKNENHVSWLDSKPYVTSPDLISVINAENGIGLPNSLEREWPYGLAVYVVGTPTNNVWLTERGLKLFSPRHFNFDIDYRPIRDLVKTN